MQTQRNYLTVSFDFEKNIIHVAKKTKIIFLYACVVFDRRLPPESISRNRRKNVRIFIKAKIV